MEWRRLSHLERADPAVATIFKHALRSRYTGLSDGICVTRLIRAWRSTSFTTAIDQHTEACEQDKAPSMRGAIAEFAMRITFRTIGVLAVWSVLAAHVSAAPSAIAPFRSTAFHDGRTVALVGSRLVVKAHDVVPSAVHIDRSVRDRLRSASSVEFPEGEALRSGGGDYFMVVINRPSAVNPQGYCGSGEEGNLYVLRLRQNTANVALSVRLQSCLQDVELASDGVQSSYKPIASDAWAARHKNLLGERRDRTCRCQDISVTRKCLC